MHQGAEGAARQEAEWRRGQALEHAPDVRRPLDPEAPRKAGQRARKGEHGEADSQRELGSAQAREAPGRAPRRGRPAGGTVGKLHDVRGHGREGHERSQELAALAAGQGRGRGGVVGDQDHGGRERRMGYADPCAVGAAAAGGGDQRQQGQQRDDPEPRDDLHRARDEEQAERPRPPPREEGLYRL